MPPNLTSKIIAIHSFRGGTGKSNLTANLAVAIALQGNRVAVVDTDLQSPGIHTLFGLGAKIPGNTLNDYLWNRSSIQSAAYNVSAQLGIEGKGQVFLVPASIEVEEIARILSEGYNVSLLSNGFRQLIQELELDYLLIDTHPGLTRETLLSIAIADLLMMILRPDQQDYQGTAVTIDIAHQLKVRQIMLVINKALKKMDVATLQQTMATTCNVAVSSILPFSEDMLELGSRGVFCLHYPNHPFTQLLNNIATQIVQQSSLVVSN